MGLNNLPIFAIMTKQMAWLTKRQEVLAQNIANADTPDYRPRDLLPLKFRDMLRPSQQRGLEMKTTSGAHMSQMLRKSAFRDATQKQTYETAPDGNAVVLEEQLMKVTENQGSFRLVTNLYRKHVNMIRIALGQGR